MPLKIAFMLQTCIPHLTRSSLHRGPQRHGILQPSTMKDDAPIRRKFKSFPIGNFHINIVEVRTEEGKLYLLVAIKGIRRGQEDCWPQASYRGQYRWPVADGQPEYRRRLRKRRSSDHLGWHPQTLALGQTPLCRWRVRPSQADGQGKLSRLRRRDHPSVRRSERLQGATALSGRRAHLWMDDPMATPRARL